MNILQMFSYPFMQRALIAGVLVSLCAALLGVPLVLKRYSMIGDGLSHVSFGALAIAVALGVTPLYFSIPVVILAAFFLLRMASHPHWNSDAAIAAVSASALAIGILVISRTTGMTTDVDNYMFGSVLAMTKGDVALSVVLMGFGWPAVSPSQVYAGDGAAADDAAARWVGRDALRELTARRTLDFMAAHRR